MKQKKLKQKIWVGGIDMAMMFTGMLIGGVIGTIIGGLAILAKDRSNEITRLCRENKELKANIK